MTSHLVFTVISRAARHKHEGTSARTNQPNLYTAHHLARNKLHNSTVPNTRGRWVFVLMVSKSMSVQNEG